MELLLENFLLKFDHLLLEDHRKELLHNHSLLVSYSNIPKIISKYGKHYTSCPWSSDDVKSGPDTCECCDVERIVLKTKKLLHFYYRLVNKKCEGCLFKNCFQ